MASSTVIVINCGIEYATPSVQGSFSSAIASEYREPWHAGHSISTSGRNCTSSEIDPVPSHVAQRSLPVL